MITVASTAALTDRALAVARAAEAKRCAEIAKAKQLQDRLARAAFALRWAAGGDAKRQAQ